jgi:hypothetical protein
MDAELPGGHQPLFLAVFLHPESRSIAMLSDLLGYPLHPGTVEPNAYHLFFLYYSPWQGWFHFPHKHLVKEHDLNMDMKNRHSEQGWLVKANARAYLMILEAH